MRKLAIGIALMVVLSILACSPEEVGVLVDTSGGKLDRIANVPEMTRWDYNVTNFLGQVKSIRELEPQLFGKSRWEMMTEAGDMRRVIVNEKDADEIIAVLSYQVILTESNVGLVTAINTEGLHDDRIGRIAVHRIYVTEDGLHGIRAFVVVNHPGKVVMSYLNCREVRFKENTVEIVNENIDLEKALNKHRRWITQKAEGRKAVGPAPSAPQKLSEEELMKLPPTMRQGR